MNVNIKKMQTFFYQMKYNCKGHWRSQKVIFMFKNSLFLRNRFSFKNILNSNIQHFSSWYKLDLLKGHWRSLFKFLWKSFVFFCFLFFYYEIVWPYDNLDLYSYGQILSLFLVLNSDIELKPFKPRFMMLINCYEIPSRKKIWIKN